MKRSGRGGASGNPTWGEFIVDEIVDDVKRHGGSSGSPQWNEYIAMGEEEGSEQTHQAEHAEHQTSEMKEFSFFMKSKLRGHGGAGNNNNNEFAL